MKFGTREIIWLTIGLVVGVVVGAVITGAASQLVQRATILRGTAADPKTFRHFSTLLIAMTADDYDQFVSVVTDPFRQQLTPETFHTISRSLAPRMRTGCTPTYLGQFRQTGTLITLWRLGFGDGGDDRLVRMSLSQDQVDGFVITPAF